MKGHLVIAGGNIKDDIIYKEFVKLAGGKDAIIAIVPTAAEDANDVLLDYTKVFVSCGVLLENIIPIKIDPGVEVDSGWKSNGDEFEELDFLKHVTGIWFSGGDQIRIVKSFLRRDGSPTEVLKRIKTILDDGGVVGGSSAGAAIMSSIMIGGGTSVGALSMKECKDPSEYRKSPELEKLGVLLISKGLDFFQEGIIDQHFDKRSRLGRLIETMFLEKVNKGFGISENSALVYDRKKGVIDVLGTGGITIVDIKGASGTKVGAYSKYSNIKIGFLEAGNSYDLKKDEYRIRNSDELCENPYFAYESYILNINFKESPVSGTESSNKALISYSNENKMHYISSYQSCNEEAGYEIRVYGKKSNRKGFAGSDLSFTNAMMDILPILLEDKLFKEVME